MKKTSKEKVTGQKRSSYLEVYIEADGKLIFNHLTEESLPLLRSFARKKIEKELIYCG